MTVQPRSAYCLANSRPMPWLEPVMRTVSACAWVNTADRQRIAARVRTRLFTMFIIDFPLEVREGLSAEALQDTQLRRHAYFVGSAHPHSSLAQKRRSLLPGEANMP